MPISVMFTEYYWIRETVHTSGFNVQIPYEGHISILGTNCAWSNKVDMLSLLVIILIVIQIQDCRALDMQLYFHKLIHKPIRILTKKQNYHDNSKILLNELLWMIKMMMYEINKIWLTKQPPSLKITDAIKLQKERKIYPSITFY